MKKLLLFAFIVLSLINSTDSRATIYGATSGCVGNSNTLHDSTGSTISTGGTWSSSNPVVATVDISTGVVTGISPGVVTITYSGTSGIATALYTVNPNPIITVGGSGAICVGASIPLSCSPSGGFWNNSTPSVLSLSVLSGIATGVSAGTSTITYTVSGCSTTTVLTVLPTVYDTVTGPSAVCTGSTVTLSAVAPGSVWASSNVAVATVNSSGDVTGISVGTATITHTASGTCVSGVVTHVVTVNGTPGAGTITGPATVLTGSTIALSNSVTGGTWSSSTPSVATIDASGVVTGIGAGITTITYTVTGCGSSAFATYTVTVSVPNCISGNVLFTGAAYSGPVKVWLIKYDPTTHMLSADDSMIVSATGTSAFYQFCGMGTDSFRVKAACDVTFTGSGYLPTYHAASSFWNTANVVNHVSGTNDINKHITMNYGTATTGPGFIAGDVTTGANKGTADGDPVAGMRVYCIENTSGAILLQTITDASGHYTFSNLPVGASYSIYPEVINYATTAYPSITLSSGTPSMMAANFIQHTLSMTITPVMVGVGNVNAANQNIVVFPNPASSTLNVSWDAAHTGNATINIADVTGRNVFSTTANMSNGSCNLDLSGMSPGLYMIHIKSEGINYNAKVEIK